MLFDRSTDGADYERLVVVQDRPSGLRAIVALHSTRRGPAFGGIRRRRYVSDSDALSDVLRLAEAMSAKCALAGLDAGGGKTVIVDQAGLDKEAAYRALGRAVESLGGEYVCGPDVGTSEAELDFVRQETRHVNPQANDAAQSTARGVLASLRGVLRHLDGQESFAGKKFVVQGFGSVGLLLTKTLLEAGAQVAGHDVDGAANQAAAAAGATVLRGAGVLQEPCDVLVPCALGGVLSRAAARELRCRAVCGSANNQLARPEAADALAERNIVVVPDIVSSAGAVIEGVLTYRGGETPELRAEVERTIDAIETTTFDLLEEAARTQQVPHAVADERAGERLS